MTATDWGFIKVLSEYGEVEEVTVAILSGWLDDWV